MTIVKYSLKDLHLAFSRTKVSSQLC